jgi:hypothetical protein
MRIRYIAIAVVLLALGFGVGRLSAAGGTLDSPAPPGSTSSYTLEGIYNRLNAGIAGSPSTFTEPASGPTAGTGHTLDEIIALAPAADDTNGAVPGDVLTGKTYWSLRTDGTWGTQAGTMPNRSAVVYTPGTSDQTVAAGYHNGSGHVVGDGDLVAGNIRSGVNIFEVAGDPDVVNTSSGDATAGDILSDRKAWVDGGEVTGERYGGCTCTGTLNGTRWCDNGDGTVTDLTTCLAWLQDASWGGQKPWRDSSGYDDAHTRAITATGTGGWRVPTFNELAGLTEGTEAVLSGNMRAFTGVVGALYWSSTTDSSDTSRALVVSLYNGLWSDSVKTDTHYVWPVRDGQ